MRGRSVFLIGMVSSLSAQTEPTARTSGPEVGAPLTRISVSAASGPHAGTTFDAAVALANAPCALLFVHELTRNTAPLIRALDRFAVEYGLLDFRSFTVLLADDRAAAEKQIERSSTALELRNPIVVSTDGSDGPGGYGLNRKCTLTLVIGKAGKVTRAMGLTDVGAQDVPQLEGWIAEVAGALPSDAASWRKLIAQRYPQAEAELVELTATLLVQTRKQEQNNARTRMRQEASAPPNAPMTADGTPREGRAPDDPELRTLLRASIQKTATESDLDDVFSKIDARVGDDAGLRAQAVEMFKLVLGLGYGTDAAQARAKNYVAAHGGKGDGKK